MMKTYEVHVRIIDLDTDATFMETHLKAGMEAALDVLDSASTWLETCEYDEPTEAQLERMARGDHYPDYAYMQAEARKLK